MSPETEASIRATLATAFADFETFAKQHLFPVLDGCTGRSQYVDKAIQVAKADIGQLLLSLKAAQTAPSKATKHERTITQTLGADLPPNLDSLDGRFEVSKSDWQANAESMLAERFAGNVVGEREFIQKALGLRNVRSHRLTEIQWQRVYSALCENPV